MNKIDVEQKSGVRRAFIVDEIDSTNDAAKRALRDGEPTPFLYCAERQTSGRGRGDHRWVDWNGALLFSLAARWSDFHLTRQESAELSLRMGETVAETVRNAIARELGVARSPELDARTKVKKPNDVLCDDKKICGILIESPDAEFVVIGVGVNITNERLNAPRADVRERTISLLDVVASTRPDERARLLENSEALREQFLIDFVSRALNS